MDGSTPTRRKKSIGISTEKIGFVVTQICDIARLSRDDSAAITVRLARLQPSRLCGAARKELGAPFGATCGCNGIFRRRRQAKRGKKSCPGWPQGCDMTNNLRKQ
jgi:hypothetical protein